MRRAAQSAAHLVDQVMPRVPVRQWVLSFPIPLRIVFAAHPALLTPVLRIIHRVITRFLLKQAGLKRATADTGAVTLIQRFGSAANLNIHLHCLVLDGVCESPAALTGAAAGAVPGGLTLEARTVLQRGRRSGAVCARMSRSACVEIDLEGSTHRPTNPRERGTFTRHRAIGWVPGRRYSRRQ